ncbi:deoxyguanosinetriphosphate triphosphohydrolase [Desulfarculus baarsii DSM 2075]|uniref:Deoxyguanosinetriphosphate triphosphohydrolase n=1 Tax=Desulfarculus baarsii (strain ATCC 33931 / DSM 2075 / LMG 7858 / VKM B-1802 / 2st14) TaxID=644282 RepID=E1QG40_DESB2|nr:deoxyguanosinetriphosphate triphosphohydrolase [Desulfarculus baarsii]ADK84650.1 deoxyguanosinetriphosphate triphosphohydrolase [Desulfarculus baarsii DSM 2075]
MTLREELERREEAILSPFAARSAASKGRARPEPPCAMRPAFQHDRDRILYSKAFRRLKHKTQVFLAPTGDHYRTRLTHTLEVAQIARTMARALALNEDLTEAVALGHDLGHTPFGHAGEAQLNQLLPGGFRHYEQSLRVVDLLEKDGRGLNLTHEVRMGILHHSKGKGGFLCCQGDDELTLEARLVRCADVMAYVAHDTDDAIRGGVIDAQELPPAVVRTLGRKLGDQIDTMVRDLVGQTRAAGGANPCMSPAVEEAIWRLREFLYARVYDNMEVHHDFIKASKIIRELWERLSEDDEQYQRHVGALPPADQRARRTADYVAGMSDHYALRIYEKIFLPRPWAVM